MTETTVNVLTSLSAFASGSTDADYAENTTSIPTNAIARTNAITTDTVLKVIYILIGSVALLGNGCVVMVIFTSTSMRKQLTNTFIINQSLVDGLAGFLLILTTIFEDDGRHLSGLADEIYCRAWLSNIPLWAAFMSSSMNLIAITLERFISVWKPIWHKTSFTRGKAAVLLVLVWIFGPSFSFVYASLSSVIINGRCYPFGVPGTRSLIFGSFLILLQFILPVVVFTVCYSAIAVILMRKQKQFQTESSSSKPATASKNIIKTMALVSVCFALCWTINQVYYFMHLLGHQMDFASPFYHFSVALVFLNCCCNPFVYILKYKEFQRKVQHLLCCKSGKIQPRGPESTHMTG